MSAGSARGPMGQHVRDRGQCNEVRKLLNERPATANMGLETMPTEIHANMLGFEKLVCERQRRPTAREQRVHSSHAVQGARAAASSQTQEYHAICDAKDSRQLSVKLALDRIRAILQTMKQSHA